MAKGRYTLMLDTEAHTIVKNHLRALGMSLSGFLNALLCEYAKEVKGQPVRLDRKLEDLTLKEFGDLASYWFHAVHDAEAEEKEAEGKEGKK